MDDTEHRHDQQRRGRREGDDGADQHDLSHLPEPVGVQEQAAQRLTAEDGLHLLGQRGVLRVGQRRRGQLRIGLAAADLPQVHGDEVVRIRLGLCAGGHLLAGVGRHGVVQAPQDEPVRVGDRPVEVEQQGREGAARRVACGHDRYR